MRYWSHPVRVLGITSEKTAQKTFSRNSEILDGITWQLTLLVVFGAEVARVFRIFLNFWVETSLREFKGITNWMNISLSFLIFGVFSIYRFRIFSQSIIDLLVWMWWRFVVIFCVNTGSGGHNFQMLSALKKTFGVWNKIQWDYFFLLYLTLKREIFSELFFKLKVFIRRLMHSCSEKDLPSSSTLSLRRRFERSEMNFASLTWSWCLNSKFSNRSLYFSLFLNTRLRFSNPNFFTPRSLGSNFLNNLKNRNYIRSWKKKWQCNFSTIKMTTLH